MCRRMFGLKDHLSVLARSSRGQPLSNKTKNNSNNAGTVDTHADTKMYEERNTNIQTSKQTDRLRYAQTSKKANKTNSNNYNPTVIRQRKNHPS